MIDEDFRTFLLTLLPTLTSDVGGVNLSTTPIEKGKSSSVQTPPIIVYQRSESNRDLFLDGTGQLYETAFDVECYALDEPTAQVLAQAIKEGPNAGIHGANGFRGTWGSGPGTFIHGAFAQDHSDDYQPKLLDADEGYSVASLQVQVIHETA